MLSKDKDMSKQVIFFSMEDFVAKYHLLRKTESAVEYTYIYSIAGDLYCPDNGRPSIDPVVLFKMVLSQHHYGILSLRKTSEKISINVACRWFLVYSMNETIPHFAAASYNFKHRFTKETIEKVFNWILIDDERMPVIPYKRTMGENFFNLMNMYMINIMIALSARLMKF